MPDTQVKIVITGESGQAVQAAKQAEAQLKTLGETAKSTVAPGMDRVKEASTGAAGAFGRVLAGARGLVNLLPGLGMAGLVGLTASAVTWLAKLVVGSANASESLENLKDKIKTVKQSLEQSDAKHHEFALFIEMMRKQTEDAKKALQDRLEMLDEYYDQLRKLAEKNRELALSEAQLIQDPAKRTARVEEIQKGYGQFSASVAKDEARSRIIAQDTALVNRYTSAQSKAQQLDAQIAEKEAVRRNVVALAAAQRQSAEEARKEAETLRKKFGSGAFASPEEHQRVLAAEKYATQMEEQAKQSAARARQQNAELSALEEQRKTVQREILSIDPNAVKAARERMLSPHLLNQAVENATAFDRHITGIEANIDRNREIRKLQNDERNITNQLRNAEEQARRAAMAGATGTLRLTQQKIEELNAELRAIYDAISRIRNPSSNSRLDY